MKQFYKVTIRTCDIFNFTTSVILKQYDTHPLILDVHDSKDGQLVDLRISCTQTEKFLVRAALKDYILKMVPVNAKGRDLTFMERWSRLWY